MPLNVTVQQIGTYKKFNRQGYMDLKGIVIYTSECDLGYYGNLMYS